MAKDREHFNIEDDGIDLEELVGISQDLPSKEEYIKMQKIGEKFGFVDRSPKVKIARKRTPYIIQHNSKMRVGMKELLSDLTEYVGAKSDQETLELGILALIEKKEARKLLKKFNSLIKES